MTISSSEVSNFISTGLPTPQSHQLLRWDSTESQLENTSLMQLGAIQIISTMADLYATPGSIGDQYYLMGYYSDADGGQGVFSWDDNSAASDNGGTIILPTGHIGNGRWIRHFSGYINVRWFGAKGNYLQADLGASAHDDTAAIQAAFDATPMGCTLFIPKGLYKLTGSINRIQTVVSVSVTFNIKGEGVGSVLVQTTSSHTFVFDGEINDMAGWSLEDFSITYRSGMTAGHALDMRHCNHGCLKNVYITGAGEAGLHLKHGICNTYINLVVGAGIDIRDANGDVLQPFTRAHRGIWVEGPAPLNLAPGANIFIGGSSETITGGDPGTAIAVKVDYGRGTQFYNMTIQNSPLGIQIAGDHLDWVIDGCWLESNTVQWDLGNGQGRFRPGGGDCEARYVCQYRAKGVRSSTQSIPDDTNTLIAFNTNEYNVGYSGDIHSASSNPHRFVAPVDGLYNFTAHVGWAQNGTGARQLYIRKNDEATVLTRQIDVASGIDIWQSLNYDILLQKDEWVSIGGQQNSGGALNVLAGSYAAFRFVDINTTS